MIFILRALGGVFFCLILTSTEIKIHTISVSLSWTLPFCFRKPALYLTASLRCHRQADVNTDPTTKLSVTPLMPSMAQRGARAES